VSRTAVLYDGAGNIVGKVWVSQDGDLELQDQPRLFEVPNEHAAAHAPDDWRVILNPQGRPTGVARRP
jgi:hypothetical protein